MNISKYTKSNIISALLFVSCIALGIISFILFGFKKHSDDSGQYIIAIATIITPCISLFAAIMFYRAINAQLNSNEILEVGTELNTILKFYDYIVSEIENFQHSEFFASLQMWTQYIHQQEFEDISADKFTFEFRSILTSLVYTKKKIDNSKLSNDDKEAIHLKLYLLYCNKMRRYVEAVINCYNPTLESNRILQENWKEIHIVVTKIYEEIKNQGK